MQLADRARELIRVLQSIVASLDRYGRAAQNDYVLALSDRLRPLVLELEAAIATAQDRSRAEEVLLEIGPVMNEVNGAATKGELEIFSDDALERYWDLVTIFRESRFAAQTL